MHERIQRVRDHQDRCEHRLAYHRLFGPTDNRKRQTNNAQTIDATPRGQTIICPSKLSYDRHAREAEEFETSPRAAPIVSEGPPSNGLMSSLSFLLCHPKAEAAELIVINELDSSLFKCRLNSDQS